MWRSICISLLCCVRLAAYQEVAKLTAADAAADDRFGHRVAMVGDALETDILGASSTGIASVLVASGIHGAALGCTDLAGDKLPTAEDLARLCEEFGGVRPDHVLPRFVW